MRLQKRRLQDLKKNSSLNSNDMVLMYMLKSVKWGWLAYTTSTVLDICTFAILSVRSLDLFCRFIRVYEGHFLLCYKEEFLVELSR